MYTPNVGQRVTWFKNVSNICTCYSQVAGPKCGSNVGATFRCTVQSDPSYLSAQCQAGQQSCGPKHLMHWMGRLHVLWGAVTPTQNEKSYLDTQWRIMRGLIITYFNNHRHILRHSYVPSSNTGINITDATWRIFMKFDIHIMPTDSTQWRFFFLPLNNANMPTAKIFRFF